MMKLTAAMVAVSHNSLPAEETEMAQAGHEFITPVWSKHSKAFLKKKK